MSGRSTIAFALLLTFTAAGCASAGARGPGGLADVPDARKLVRLSEKHYMDDQGRKVVVREDATGKQVVQAFDAHDKPLEIVEVPLSEIQLCPAKAKPACQPATFVSDGVFIKMGAASCYCYVYNNIPYCYGDTCR
jgi:ABC-type nitrate/sulfonate/bicarbonate transport system substrate-binding protein